MKPRNSESGSAIFIILIAIVLFAALSYTVANMLRSSDPGSLSRDTIRLYTTEILDYAHALREAVQMMKISHGCEDTDISFENQFDAAYNYAPPPGDKCRLFHGSGGGLNFVAAQPDWLSMSTENWRFLGRNCVEDVGSGDGTCATDGDDGTEELIVGLVGLKKALCVSINKELGVTNPSDQPPSGGAVNIVPFTGTYANGEKIATVGPNHLDGKNAGCFDRGGGEYFFYQVLISR
jgi:hypothetical protein